MNEAQLHLLINHFPILGTIFGLLILVAGVLLRNPSVKGTALGLFAFSALTTLVAMRTGEGAEEIVEQLPGISHDIIHHHEEHAEVFYWLSLSLGLLSLITLYFQQKQHRLLNVFYGLVFLLGLGTAVYSYPVGHSGGEIRHTEIREDHALPPAAGEVHEEDD